MREPINRLGDKNLTLRLENVSYTLKGRIDPHTSDLLHIAAYVYAADQMVSRGTNSDVFGDDFRREMYLCIPVSDPDFWSDAKLLLQLRSVLNFATDDHWSFHFSPAPREDEQLIFDGDVAELMNRPDSVLLFSGGADSLCAAVEEVRSRNGRPALVSHRPAPLTDSRQRYLGNLLRERVPGWEFPYTSVWVHRQGSEPADASQRSRAFLFASLGAAVAESIGVERVVLADNGMVSLNLPINDQLIGAKVSRSTHPKFLDSMNRFLASALNGKPQLTNPLWSRSRAECLDVLREAGLEALLQETNSCSNWRGLPNVTPHCGVCYQCVDRRFSSTAAHLEEHDLKQKYKVEIFRQELPAGVPLMTAVSYVKFARKIVQLENDVDLLLEFPDLLNCVDTGDRDPDATMRSLVEMLRRHARGVLNVLADEISQAGEGLAFNRLPETCLVRLSVQPEPGIAVHLRMLAPQLTESEEADFKRQGFRSRLPIEINGRTTSKKSNVVMVNSQEAVLDDADFAPFLRLVLALFETTDGFVSRESLRHGSGIDGEGALMPQGIDQALARMRKSFRGRIGSLSRLDFIEAQRGQIRLSTHLRYLAIDENALLSHLDERVRGLAERIRTAKQRLSHEGPESA